MKFEVSIPMWVNIEVESNNPELATKKALEILNAAKFEHEIDYNQDVPILVQEDGHLPISVYDIENEEYKFG